MRSKLLWLLLALPLLFWACSKDDDENETTPPHDITLTTPNGGETWQVGSTHAIVWTDHNVAQVTIRLSLDNGTNWIDLATNVANTHAYNWTIAAVPATTCKIKVMDAADTTVADESNATFTLVEQSAEDNASGSVGSGEAGSITTPAGAAIHVPIGAVPPQEDGTPGTMVFSIESDANASITPPTGETLASTVYHFGPEGFTLARPAEVVLPVTATGDPGLVKIWRVNDITGRTECFGGNYNAETHTISAQTYQFSTWYVTTGAENADAQGCLNVSNTSGHWVSLCAAPVTLEYPNQVIFLPALGGNVIYAPQGTTGWASEGHWFLPQGTYNICADYESAPGVFVHKLYENITIAAPWLSTAPACVDLAVGMFTDSEPGRCECIPTPTTSVGTGDIQVTLVWHCPTDLDLDLWVMDPDSEWCYFGNGQAPSTTESGGQLDRDNLCGNYINGRPENIYWTQTPPSGEYIVGVDWFSDCGDTEETSMPVSVRTVVQGVTRTFNATIQEMEVNMNPQEVTRFQVVGTTVTFLPPREGGTLPNLPAPHAKVQTQR